jgi:hypothetical protein
MFATAFGSFDSAADAAYGIEEFCAYTAADKAVDVFDGFYNAFVDGKVDWTATASDTYADEASFDF